MAKTTIQIEKETLNKLKKIKLTKRESYDEIVNRLIKDGTNTKIPKDNRN